MKRILLSVAALAAATHPARAWFGTGHQLVAQIAWDSLSDRPDLQSRLRACIQRLPDARYQDFVVAANWPDAIKSRRYRMEPSGRAFEGEKHSSWHFKDVPFFRGEGAHPVQPKGESLEDGLPIELALMEDPGTDPSIRAEALSWVVHLVGDVHQPLHCVSLFSPSTDKGDGEGDRGGNLYPIESRQTNELHAYWDSVAESYDSRRKRPTSMARVRSEARRLEHEFPQTALKAEARDLSLKHWIRGSYLLAQTVAYALPEGAEPSREYHDKALHTCRRQLALAGYRLSNLLRAHFR